MTARVEKVFEVALPVARVWRAFAESEERSQWEADPFEIEARPGGRVHWELPGMACEGRVVEVVPERLLVHTERSGPHAETRVSVAFEPVPGGTRVTLVHEGFAGPEAGALAAASTEQGWDLALADLFVWLERGVPARRFVRRWMDPGLEARQTRAGLEITSVAPGGFAEKCGLASGDLLLAVGGAPVTSFRELWVLTKEHGPGAKLSAEFLRGRERLVGSASL
jgi:uncharacterized protein YndB with AHSA1/START domain